MLFYKKKFVYHIHDIREIFIDNRLINRFARTVEKVLLKRLSILVVSSYAFYENHFLKHYNFPSSNVFLLENKLESDPLLSTSDKLDIPIDNGTIKIGYYGVLRCNRSWDILKTAIALAKGRLVLNARGVHDQINNFTLDVSKSENINYDGSYKGFDDLEEMYQKFDIVWAAYPFGNHKNGNRLWARTVRFYEACAFGRPVIVQANTQQAKDVLKYNIGLVVDMSNIEQAAKQILSITPVMINTWKSNLAGLDRSMFIHTDEYTQLYSIIIKS
jgi:glycosyltransferase involved in cell wall biosynthesis